MTTELRYWRDSDVESLTKLCNETDRTFLTDALPFPYTAEYAVKRIEYCKQEEGKGGIYRLSFPRFLRTGSGDFGVKGVLPYSRRKRDKAA